MFTGEKWKPLYFERMGVSYTKHKKKHRRKKGKYMIEILNEFVKRRNAAIESNSIKEFDSFMEWAHQVGMYDDEHYKQWQLFDKDMKLRIINKMASTCEVSNARREQAYKWLKEHDSKPLC